MADAPWSRDDPRLRARLMEALGGVAWWQADIPSMGFAYAEALELWQAIGDKREIANALYNDSFRYAVSEAPGQDRDPDRTGYNQMNRARELATEVGDERGRANALWGIGNWLYFHDAEDRGSMFFEEALAVFRRLGDRTMEAWSHHMLGTAQIRTGPIEESRRNVTAALLLFHGYGDVAGITLSLDDFASIAIAVGDLPRAARLWGAARALSAAGGVGLADFVDSRFEFYGRPNARHSIDPAELDRYALEGRAMTLDESVAYALETNIDDLAPHDHAGAVR